MAQLSFDIDSVDYSAGGLDGTLDMGAYPAVTLAAVLEYGARRYVQDYINSAIHAAWVAHVEAKGLTFPNDAARKEAAKAWKGKFDAKPILAARLSDMMEGKVERTRSVRSAVSTLALGFMVDALASSDKSDNRLVVKAINAAKGADAAKLKREAWDRLPESARDHFTKLADEETARREAAKAQVKGMDLGAIGL